MQYYEMVYYGRGRVGKKVEQFWNKISLTPGVIHFLRVPFSHFLLLLPPSLQYKEMVYYGKPKAG